MAESQTAVRLYAVPVGEISICKSIGPFDRFELYDVSLFVVLATAE